MYGYELIEEYQRANVVVEIISLFTEFSHTLRFIGWNLKLIHQPCDTFIKGRGHGDCDREDE